MKSGASAIIMKHQSASEGVKLQTRTAWPGNTAGPRRIGELGHIDKRVLLTRFRGGSGAAVHCRRRRRRRCRASRTRRAACARARAPCDSARRPATRWCWTRSTSGSEIRRASASSPSSSMYSACRSPQSCCLSTTCSSGSPRTRNTRSARCQTLSRRKSAQHQCPLALCPTLVGHTTDTLSLVVFSMRYQITIQQSTK